MQCNTWRKTKWESTLLQDCPPEFAEVIKDCWQNEPSLRPSFEQVVTRIAQVIQKYFPEVQPIIMLSLFVVVVVFLLRWWSMGLIGVREQAANYDAEVIRAYKEAQNNRNALDRAHIGKQERPRMATNALGGDGGEGGDGRKEHEEEEEEESDTPMGVPWWETGKNPEDLSKLMEAFVKRDKPSAALAKQRKHVLIASLPLPVARSSSSPSLKNVLSLSEPSQPPTIVSKRRDGGDESTLM